MMSYNAIQIENLTKTYEARKGKQAKEALKGITLDIPKGSFFGLLGPNGAGKSTMINIMAGLVLKSSGSVKILGHCIIQETRKAKQSIGIVPQELMVDTFFTVREALDFHAGYYGVPQDKRRTQEIIDALGLTQQADIYSRRLSGGMKRRLLVAKALVHNPPVLVLDEPTAGVDVELRDQLWEYVKGLNRTGTTVLLTTHYLEEAQELCDRIAIINHGQLVANDTKRALMQTIGRKVISMTPSSPVREIPEALNRMGSLTITADEISVEFDSVKYNSGDIVHAAINSGIRIKDITVHAPTLEEVFRQYTKVS